MYRSRLNSIQERKNVRKAFLISAITIALLIAAAILGIPILSGIALFFGDLKSSSEAIDTQDHIPPVAPRIILSYEATNSARQVISGFAEAGSSVFLTQNGESQGESIASEDGQFQFTDIFLELGENSFSAVAIDQGGNKSLASSNVRLIYVNKGPDLQVESPVDRQQVSGERNSVDVRGQTTSGVRLTINDRTIIVSPSGKFSTTYSLNEGDNALVFIATDQAGNQTRKEMVVSYQK